ncbi:Os03g0571250 [Oryza sativa Japonica Group]|uniref:Os03g0571250 protein n=1 Tax=Oryza sativa subsp. japonica TaxID=39947 RepID=A0A0P0VZF2_ORYSJ|nr:Os03g0571250 [Oryza sativa Japonica Group]
MRRASCLDVDSPHASLLLRKGSLPPCHPPPTRLHPLPLLGLAPLPLSHRYKSLSKSLHSSPASFSPAISSAIKEALWRATNAYATLAEQATAPILRTF